MTGVALDAGAALLAEPHPEILEEPDAPGGQAVVRLRVPHALRPDQVVVRCVQDAPAQQRPARQRPLAAHA